MGDYYYNNGVYEVFSIKGGAVKAYGIRRIDRPQDGMIFSHIDPDFCRKIADEYKQILSSNEVRT